ncbi:MAG TPA: hypothetical protein PK876_06830 [Elusimicrobiota bacterium]|nr:hypothetical protein [Elusimicrobiota bacterium]
MWFAKLLEVIKRYIFLEKDELYPLVGVYVVLTYCWDIFESLPYLWFCGPVGSGKTTLLDLLSCLVDKPLKVSEVTWAALRRELNSKRPTALIDEGDYLDAPPMRRLLRVGYKRGGVIIIADHGDSTISYNVYGPKIIAHSDGPKDKGLESRCIMLSTLRSPRGHIRFSERAVSQENAELKPSIRDWCDKAGPRILGKYTTLDFPIMLGIPQSRLIDLWSPLLSISMTVDEEFPNLRLTDTVLSMTMEHIHKFHAYESLEDAEGIVAQRLIDFIAENPAGDRDGFFRPETLLLEVRSLGGELTKYTRDRLSRYLKKHDAIIDSKRWRLPLTINGNRRYAFRTFYKLNTEKLVRLAKTFFPEIDSNDNRPAN